MGAGESAEVGLDSSRFFQELNAVVLKPAVVGLPGLPLAFCAILAHDRSRSEQSKEPELREAAKEKARGGRQTFEPRASGRVVNMAVIGESNPDVDIREKK